MVTFRDVDKSYHRVHNRGVGIKHALLHPAAFWREWRAAPVFPALQGISFSILRGQTVGICGRNGAGKSTALSLMAGVIRPNRGQVSVSGRVSPLLELGAGFHAELTGRENVYLNGVILGLTHRQVAGRMDAILEFSELEDSIDQPLRTYSSGMFMRLAFSVAVHTDPEILLVDEVLAVGDVGFQKKCLDKMGEFKKSGVTIVFVSHDFPMIQRICDRTIVLDSGKVIADGAPADVERFYREPNLAGKGGHGE